MKWPKVQCQHFTQWSRVWRARGGGQRSEHGTFSHCHCEQTQKTFHLLTSRFVFNAFWLFVFNKIVDDEQTGTHINEHNFCTLKMNDVKWFHGQVQLSFILFADMPLTDPYECGVRVCPHRLCSWALGVPGFCFPSKTGIRLGKNGFKRLVIQVK